MQKTGYIVWAYGDVRAGEMNDLQLACSNFVNHLDEGEKVIADSRYRDLRYFINAPSLLTY